MIRLKRLPRSPQGYSVYAYSGSDADYRVEGQSPKGWKVTITGHDGSTDSEVLELLAEAKAFIKAYNSHSAKVGHVYRWEDAYDAALEAGPRAYVPLSEEEKRVLFEGASR